MLKYYIVLFLIAGVVLFYSYRADPCNVKFKTDFVNRYPGYQILNSGAGEEDSDRLRAVAGGRGIHCHIYYQKPDNEQVYEDIWLYEELSSGWNFSRIVATNERTEE